jgi:hypothetical protein
MALSALIKAAINDAVYMRIFVSDMGLFQSAKYGNQMRGYAVHVKRKSKNQCLAIPKAIYFFLRNGRLVERNVYQCIPIGQQGL